MLKSEKYFMGPSPVSLRAYTHATATVAYAVHKYRYIQTAKRLAIRPGACPHYPYPCPPYRYRHCSASHTPR